MTDNLTLTYKRRLERNKKHIALGSAKDPGPSAGRNTQLVTAYAEPIR